MRRERVQESCAFVKFENYSLPQGGATVTF